MQTTNTGDGPGDDEIGDICKAIATAEGYGVHGAIPTVRNNPGDLEKVPGLVTTYPTVQAGWDALRAQVTRIMTGTSTAGYRPDMPIIQISAIYVLGNLDATQDSNVIAWATNVANALDLTVNDPLTAYSRG